MPTLSVQNYINLPGTLICLAAALGLEQIHHLPTNRVHDRRPKHFTFFHGPISPSKTQFPELSPNPGLGEQSLRSGRLETASVTVAAMARLRKSRTLICGPAASRNETGLGPRKRPSPARVSRAMNYDVYLVVIVTFDVLSPQPMPWPAGSEVRTWP
jgi:hypothetical protein